MTAQHSAAGYYEPWRPEVGQRVRVRLNGECPFWAHQWDQGDLSYEDGCIATVTRLVSLEANAGHRYEVRFDEPCPHPPEQQFPRLIGSMYAAIELEPIS